MADAKPPRSRKRKVPINDSLHATARWLAGMLFALAFLFPCAWLAFQTAVWKSRQEPNSTRARSSSVPDWMKRNTAPAGLGIEGSATFPAERSRAWDIEVVDSFSTPSTILAIAFAPMGNEEATGHVLAGLTNSSLILMGGGTPARELALGSKGRWIDQKFEVMRAPDGRVRFVAVDAGDPRVVAFESDGRVAWQRPLTDLPRSLASGVGLDGVVRITAGASRAGEPLVFVSSAEAGGLTCLGWNGDVLWSRRVANDPAPPGVLFADGVTSESVGTNPWWYEELPRSQAYFVGSVEGDFATRRGGGVVRVSAPVPRDSSLGEDVLVLLARNATSRDAAVGVAMSSSSTDAMARFCDHIEVGIVSLPDLLMGNGRRDSESRTPAIRAPLAPSGAADSAAAVQRAVYTSRNGFLTPSQALLEWSCREFILDDTGAYVGLVQFMPYFPSYYPRSDRRLVPPGEITFNNLIRRITVGRSRYELDMPLPDADPKRLFPVTSDIRDCRAVFLSDHQQIGILVGNQMVLYSFRPAVAKEPAP